MTTVREFVLDDLFKFNHIAFDPLVEVYSLPFLFPKIIEHPELALSVVAPDNRLMGFVLGCRIVDTEETIGDGKDLGSSHGHVSSLAVSNDYRRLGLATLLLENLRDKMNHRNDLFMDLFVRAKNEHAIRLYESLGYVKYRWLPQFYADDHGYDMKLPLSKDVERKSLEGITINKLYSFGDMLLYLIMMYLIGIRDLVFGDIFKEN
ncbi:N-alpha-acetyltransferase 20 [Drosophila bipectinata]|uniref:N-alpha-acetyltransferase 20 n=1 Tax=Drosophila bipectinata TaxID=42026 RepID=UPI001C8A4276|nr:N-alpha-acetyltransferase 20 [Drosophila bipectinata]